MSAARNKSAHAIAGETESVEVKFSNSLLYSTLGSKLLVALICLGSVSVCIVIETSVVRGKSRLSIRFVVESVGEQEIDELSGADLHVAHYRVVDHSPLAHRLNRYTGSGVILQTSRWNDRSTFKEPTIGLVVPEFLNSRINSMCVAY